MPSDGRDLQHIFLNNHGSKEPYTSPNEGRSKPLIERNREEHANKLLGELQRVLDTESATQRDPNLRSGTEGIYLSFRVASDSPKVLESLEDRRKQIELVSVQKRKDTEPFSATIFLPKNHSNHFLSRIEEYRTTDSLSGQPKHGAFVSRLEGSALATIRSLFTDELDTFPKNNARTWWEIWLRKKASADFSEVAQKLELLIGESSITFPEREVILVYATEAALETVLRHTDAIAEVRLPKDTPRFFLDLPVIEQAEWLEDLLERTEAKQPDSRVAVCILDSGIARGHPLLTPFLAHSDTINPAWGIDDSRYWAGHGTSMAGIVLFGDLSSPLSSATQLDLSHVVESMKILPPTNTNPPELYGSLTEDAVLLAESHSPATRRIICLAVTSARETDGGKPSSWSAAIDQLSFGHKENKRLVIISAGNLTAPIHVDRYPDRNDISEIESPAQAWNALTVGAFTNKSALSDPALDGWECIAPAGGLSPSSRTSTIWQSQWPIKPDIVMEGGNYAVDGVDTTAWPTEDTSLLTTNHDFATSLFKQFSGTSAATALASQMAAKLAVAFPQHWPETTRALMVHSAEWTHSMLAQLGTNPTQARKLNLLRRYGYGVPNIGRALRSARNDLTLIIQDQLLPFSRKSNRIATNEMNLHQFPWPSALFEGLGESTVELRTTLSYFIEPNPGSRGWSARHNYASHGLRFDVKGVIEDEDSFRQRINRAARPGASKVSRRSLIDADKWFFRQARTAGSIYSDIWKGTAAEFTQKSAIGVFPTAGWWREKRSLERWNQNVRYALIVSIRLLEDDVDIYTPISQALNIPVGIPTKTEV